MILISIIIGDNSYNPEEEGKMFDLRRSRRLAERFGSWEELLKDICLQYSKIYPGHPISAVVVSCDSCD
jgi:hypothetical protein